MTKVSQVDFKLHRYEEVLGVNELGTVLFHPALQSHDMKLNRAYFRKHNNRYRAVACCASGKWPAERRPVSTEKV